MEAISSGTTNPWGHDWNEHGELFFINTVNGHLWHDFAGAHFVRPHTIDPNPRTYALIDQHADHWHFDTASGWQKSRDGAANHVQAKTRKPTRMTGSKRGKRVAPSSERRPIPQLSSSESSGRSAVHRIASVAGGEAVRCAAAATSSANRNPRLAIC